MYKALKDYPKWSKTGEPVGFERLYLTKHVIKRLASFKKEFLKCGMSRENFAETVGLEYSNLLRIFKGVAKPSLGAYLKSAEIFGWDLSFDVNYAYATVKYSPDDILRRFRRAYDKPKMTREEIALRSGHSISEQPYKVLQAMTYGPRRTLRVYALMMVDLMWIEAYDVVPDRIVIEA